MKNISHFQKDLQIQNITIIEYFKKMQAEEKRKRIYFLSDTRSREQKRKKKNETRHQHHLP